MITSALSTYLVDRIGWLLIHSLWQFTLLALVMLLMLRLMRRTSAAARYWTCLAALAAIVVAPAVTWTFLPTYTPRPDAIARGIPPGAEPIAEVAPRPVIINTEAPPPMLEAPAIPPAELPPVPLGPTVAVPEAAAPVTPWWVALEEGISPWLGELVAVWCLGVLLFALRPLWSWYMLHRLRRVGVSAVPEAIDAALERAAQRLGVRRGVRVLQSTLAGVPMVVGYLRPVILLPLSVVSGLSTAEVEAILAHELAHIRRHDYVVNLLQTLLEMVCFYHPAVWWLSSRLRREREHCCDELAARTLGNRAAYGRALLALEELRGTAPVLSLGANTGSLLERIRRLTTADQSPRVTGGIGAIASLAVMAIIATVWFWGTVGSAQTTGPQNAAAADEAEDALQDATDDGDAVKSAESNTDEQRAEIEAKLGGPQPDEFRLGTVYVGAVVEASFLIRADSDDVDIPLDVRVPAFVKVIRQYNEFRKFGPLRKDVVIGTVELAVDTSAAGELRGEIEVSLGERRGSLRIRGTVKPRRDGLRRVLVVGTPFSRFTTSYGTQLIAWTDLVEDASLDVSYLLEDRDGSVLRDHNLEPFDCVLLSSDALTCITADDIGSVRRFAEAGGRVIVTASRFMVGSVEQANKVLDGYGLQMRNEDSGESLLSWDAFTPFLAEQRVKSLRFFRASPTQITDHTQARLVVEAEGTGEPGDGFVVRAQAGKGEVIALGQSLSWHWISKEQSQGTDNAKLLRWLLAAPAENGNAGAAVPQADAVEVAQVDHDAEDPTPEDGVVQGRLVSAADGSPVAGARVNLQGSRNYYGESDAEGRFRLEGVPANSRQYELWAYAGNLISPRVQPEQTIAEDTQSARFAPLRLEMREGEQVQFVVTSTMTGEPVEGAVIRFGYPDRRKATTAANGTALVEGLFAQEYDVTIEAEGHARETPQIDLSQAEAVTTHKAALDPGGIVRGVVFDEQGSAVPEAAVHYYVSGNGYGFGGDAPRTDAEGQFRNRFLPLNMPVEISVDHDAYELHKQEVTVTAVDRETDVTITLKKRPPGKAIAGVVKETEGNPVPGAKVANYGNRGSAQDETVTDTDGKFALNNLIEGFTGYEVFVTAKRFAPAKLAVEPGTPESPGVVDVTLQPGHTARGRVVDEHGQPAKGAFVSARSGAYRMGGLGPTHRTVDDGGFAFDSLPEDVLFEVSLPGYARMRQISLPLDGEEPATITLEPPGQIHGRVVDAETGEPVRQFRVRVGFSRIRKPDDAQGSYDGKWGRPGLTFTSDDGEFLITPFTNGMPIELTVFAEGYERAVVPRAVAVVADRSEALTVSLKRIDTTERYTLSGQFLDHAGRPAVGAQLRLIVSTNQPTGKDDNDYNWVLIDSGQLGQKSYVEQYLSGLTDAEGRFEFRDILPGKYLQLAYWGEGVPQGRSLAFDETRPGAADSVTIKLPEPAHIRGTIERANFPDANSVSLVLQGGGSPEFKLKLDEDQTTFVFDDLPPGDYLVVVLAKPMQSFENGVQSYNLSSLVQQRIALRSGETKDISFTEPNVKQQ